MMLQKPTWSGVTAALQNLSDEERLAIQEYPGRFKTAVVELAKWVRENTFFTWISDRMAIEELGRPKEVVQAYRELTIREGGSGPAALLVKAGCTLKGHIPQIGPCYKDWSYLQDWNLRNDAPTQATLVHVVPRVPAKSFGQDVKGQLEFLASLRQEFSLPAHHFSSFAPAVTGAGLLLSHARLTGDRCAILREQANYVRTDTLDSDGWRLLLGYFGDSGLCCGSWCCPDRDRDASLGCFALGVEILGT